MDEEEKEKKVGRGGGKRETEVVFWEG